MHGGFYGNPYLPIPTNEPPLEDVEDFVEASLYRHRFKTDRRLTLLFVAALVAFLWLVGGQILTRSARLGSLGHARNFKGLACGFDDPVSNLPSLYLPLDPSDGQALRLMDRRGLCVARCPDEKDVAAHAFLEVPEASLIQSKGSFLWVLHATRSPVYATLPSGGPLCQPLHPTLAPQANVAFATQVARLQVLAGGLWQALPLAAAALTLAVAAGWLTALLRREKGNVLVAVWLLVSTVTAGTHGCRLLLVATESSQWLVGFSLIVVSLIAAGWTVANWPSLSQAVRLAESVRPVLPLIPAASGLYLFLQVAAVLISALGLFGFLLLQAAPPIQPTSAHINLNPNGGAEILPLERAYTTSLTSTIASLYLLVTTIWLLESIITLTKYAAVYTGAMWYFTPLDGLGQRHTSVNLPLFGFLLGLDSHLGSVSGFSVWAWISRPLRFLFLTSAPRMQEEDPRLPDEEREPAVRGEGITQRFCDLIHNGVVQETVASSRSVWESFRVSRRRVTRSIRSPGSLHAAAASTLGLPSLITWSIVGGIIVVTFVVCHSVLIELTRATQQPFTALTGAPVFTAFVIAALVGYVVCVPFVGAGALLDSLLYCVIQSQGPKEDDDLEFMDSVLKAECPKPLEDFLDLIIGERENAHTSTTASED
eukprot:Protomagalhaensia_sp_Gyna_25__314@NODE_1148_length_2135_cov_35_900763_g912_i0_p1_GENE_NODE_1148_length_2135_cov_35_900763_g912_i0NODE_1148_length_2135_cov_35_900763_g912_i0_p1_ORF_typecomplete_len662_score90_56DAD/PF02109_16/1_6e03DAD/PF02109_16/0_09_NODE_1148_length_2135_cov_35_900763_g912_i0301988